MLRTFVRLNRPAQHSPASTALDPRPSTPGGVGHGLAWGANLLVATGVAAREVPASRAMGTLTLYQCSVPTHVVPH